MLYRYRLLTRNGNEDGEAHYAMPIKPGEIIFSRIQNSQVMHDLGLDLS